ncbi:MAG TPA: helix-turn-helix domain-containing protein [Actinomycetota bacterium]|nr:helix-turn-helix domain-containing protein [Actinomycetota bacterium]
MANAPPLWSVVAVLVFDSAAVFEMAVPCEVFGIDRSAMGGPTYEVFIAAGDPPPLRTSEGGFSIDTPHGLEALERAGTIIVPSWRNLRERPPERALVALRAAYDRGARIASLCSGAFVLAHAGLLDGRRATTHWMFADFMAQQFPKVDVDPSVLYIDEGRVLTSAGTAAGIDLCLHMVRQDHGAEVANLFARRMVVPPHRSGGQAQFVEAPVPVCAGEDPLSVTMAWAIEHLGEPLTVRTMAAHAHLSTRTFARRFVATAGTSPLQWLLVQRVTAAQRLLETTDLAIDRVAETCGLGTAANLRLHFSRVVGTSPGAYRRTFRQLPTAAERDSGVAAVAP